MTTNYATERHPIRNVDRPVVIASPLSIVCEALEVVTGYLRGVANAFILKGIESSNQNYKMQFYTRADGDLLVTYYGAMDDDYRYSNYVWGGAMVLDEEQAGNIYYEFTNLVNAAVTFNLALHGLRLR